MDLGVTKHRLCITYLYDYSLNLILEKLNEKRDRESFGLTCPRFLDIQSLNRKHLDLRLKGRIDSTDLDKLLTRFTNLHSLSLPYCVKISDPGLSNLQKYGSKLQCLSLYSCHHVTAIGLISVASGCPLLSVICLSGCSITDTGLEILAKSCKSLIEVDLGWCESITDRGIQFMFQYCRQLRALNIDWCDKITGVGFHGCSSTLAYLEASACFFDSTGVTEIFSGGGLEYLNLSYHREDTRHGLAAIGLAFAANLKILDFTSCNFVEDDVIISISKGCPLLREWRLSFFEKIRISGWESIGLHCQNLMIHHVNKCSNLCDQGLLSLGNGCKRLSVIYMTECWGITPSGKRLFKLHREDVKIKEISETISFPYWRFTWPFTRNLTI